jgi:hypothetical protein
MARHVSAGESEMAESPVGTAPLLRTHPVGGSERQLATEGCK